MTRVYCHENFALCIPEFPTAHACPSDPGVHADLLQWCPDSGSSLDVGTTGNNKADWEATQFSSLFIVMFSATKTEFIVKNKDVSWLTSIHLIFISWDMAGIAINMLEIPQFTFAYWKIMYLANWTYQPKNASMLFTVYCLET